MQCPACSGRDIEFVESSGHAVCVQCGTVLEENSIVSSVEFQECGDRSHVIGQFVSATSSKSYGPSRGHSRYGFSRESRDATLSNAKRVVAQVASAMRLPPYFTDRAHRLYSLALQRSFVYGRRQMHIVATVLYTICRQEKSPHLLIDFSDVLQVNVYTLGKCFLELTRLLSLTMPVVDPSLYIHRFATRLELGDKIGAVSTTALRIVTRMKKDWIHTGRRPDGVCAAAMLVACRSYGCQKSIMEMAQIFRITTVTLKKRLNEFKSTPSAQLSVQQFHNHDMRMELDPPVFLRQMQNNALESGKYVAYSATSDDQEPGSVSSDVNPSNVMIDDRGERVQRVDVDGVEVFVPLPRGDKDKEANDRPVTAKRMEKIRKRRELYGHIYSQIGEAVDSQVDAAGPSDEISAAQSRADALFEEAETVGSARGPIGGWGSKKQRAGRRENMVISAELSVAPTHQESEDPNSSATVTVSVSDPSEQREGDTSVDDISDSEIDAFILSADEQHKKSVIWERMYRPFLDERNRKREAKEGGGRGDVYKGQGGRGRKRDRMGGAAGNTLLQDMKRSSKNINYAALEGVLSGDGGFVIPDLPKTDILASTDSSSSMSQQAGKRKITIGASISQPVPPAPAPAPSPMDAQKITENASAPNASADGGDENMGDLVEELLDEAGEEEDDDDMLVYEDHGAVDDYEDEDEYY
mmetsp:Transcript_9667/g.14557  ORF Transcript_9667/g.14557 Transcript_9667/m.14557 type:complete len:697 (+) Transcript_9667:118-2208(+)